MGGYIVHMVRMEQIKIDWWECAENTIKNEETLIKNEILKRISKLKELPHLLSVLDAEFDSNIAIDIILNHPHSFLELKCYLEEEKELNMALLADNDVAGYVWIKGIKSKDFADMKRQRREGQSLILEALRKSPDGLTFNELYERGNPGISESGRP